MTDQLTATVQYSWASVRSAASLQGETVTGVLAAFLALLTGFWTLANFVLLVVLIFVMTLDIVTAVGAAYRSKTSRFDGDRFFGGLVGKLMRIAVVALASLLDLAFAVVFPGPAGDFVRTTTPLTKGAFAWLIAGEGFSILHHVRSSEGDDAIPSLIIRALDRLKLGTEPLERRHYDEEAIALEEKLKEETAEEPGP